MRIPIAVRLLGCWLAAGVSPIHAGTQASSPTSQALMFFETLAADGDVAALLRGLRPAPVGADERARILATLPRIGVLEPHADERIKIAGLQPILVYHERQQVLDIKVIDVPQAAVALNHGAVLLVSRSALRLLSVPELQAVVAHEIGHEYFWDEFEDTRLGHDTAGRQRLELKCDGIALLTLSALKLDLSHLEHAIRKLTMFNDALGEPAVVLGEYPSVRQRLRFARAFRRSGVLTTRPGPG